jgi:HD-GYP domain-containing protein (c-di-GMP phosphodiesterase class II)/DNA-binding CsgD family transcriptional regulator
MGQELEEGLRSCFLAVKVAEELQLAPEEVTTVYYGALLKHAGCTCSGSSLADLFETDEIAARRDIWLVGDSGMPGFISWLRRHPGNGLAPPARARAVARTVFRSGPVFKEALSITMDVCSRIARRLHMPESVQEAVANLAEQWDGKGVPLGLRGEEAPVTSQVLLAAMGLQIMHKYRGRDAARSVARSQRGKEFSPRVIDAFLCLAEREEFWQGMESESISEIVMGMEPDTELANVTEDRLDDVALAFADFIDLKSPFTAAHSRRVGEISAQMAILMGCPEPEVTTIRRAALMHDLGIVAVPAYVLNRPEGKLSASEREIVRLHPYHGERILERAPSMAAIRQVVGSHHERVDGQGYFRGLRERDIPLGGRIVAVADRLDELTHERPGSPSIPVSDALEVLGRESGTALDAGIVDTLSRSLGHAMVAARPTRIWPAGLSHREVEVLRLTASGLTRHGVAQKLSIADHTVKHHLDHIYTKAGVSSKVAATLFAMENDLLP